MELVTALLIVASCLALSAFFSGSETALLRLGQHEVDETVEEARGPAALAVRDLVSSTSRLLVTILLGNNVVNILGAAVASALAVQYLGPQAGVVAATVSMTVLVLIFSEILPKAVAAYHPVGVSHLVALPLYLVHQSLRPVHLLVNRGLDPLVKRIVGGSAVGPGASSSEEILRAARRARDGQPDGTPLAIIGATAGAAEMTVQEIMVPRTEIIAFPLETQPTELLERVLEERFTRVPIFGDSIDRILGVVHLKDLIQLVRQEGSDLQGILKPILRVPERKPILRLLTDMQRGFVHLAIVKDEFGVTQGLVTQEDILEEIVGEIRDEFDREELLTIRPMGDGGYQVLGRVTVRDFNRETGWKVPAERGDTLGGLVFNTLGRSPNKGETVRVQDYTLSVADVSGSRITRVRIEKEEAFERANSDNP